MLSQSPKFPVLPRLSSAYSAQPRRNLGALGSKPYLKKKPAPDEGRLVLQIE